MVAFEIFGWPIYRYGIFYLITFVCGYIFLGWIPRQGFMKDYPELQRALIYKRDDLMLVILFGVMLGGRLGHVLFYELGYYLSNPAEILQFWQGGMAFVGGVLGVTLGLLWWRKREGISWKQFTLLGDIVLCVVPLGSLLGRIGNYLNQELWGRPVAELNDFRSNTFESVGLVRVYDMRDSIVRVNTNFIQAGLEGVLMLLIVWTLLLTQYFKRRVQPGLIIGVYLIGYAIVRFFVEFFKDLPESEMLGVLSVSQWLMIAFVLVGMGFLQQRKNPA